MLTDRSASFEAIILRVFASSRELFLAILCTPMYRPIVALESTVIAHGLPHPHGINTALECEAIVRSTGAQPATIGIVGGKVVVGLSVDELNEIARTRCRKVNLANLGEIVARCEWGATTVAATLHIAANEEIRVFSTGGIGGVHRGAEQTFDISSDITALARYPVVVVSSGAKAILDLPKTVELLETMGIPVIGYKTNEFPAFYSHSSGLQLDIRAESAAQVAAIAWSHWQLGFKSAILVTVPVPFEEAIPREVIERDIQTVLTLAAEEGITGKSVTPFLLARLSELTSGRSLRSNMALLKNNARVAAEIALELARLPLA